MNKSMYVLIVCVGLFFAGIIYYYTKAEPPKELPHETNTTAKSSNLGLTLNGTSMFEEVDGHRSWELKAEAISIDPNTKMTKFNNIKGSVYQEKGGKIDFTAQTALVEPDTHEVAMEGDIKAIASEGGRFSAEKACYFSKDKRFSATGRVKVSKEDTVITGDKMESDDSMTNIKILGKAKVIRGGETGAN